MILNKTKNARDRYTVINGRMGSYGEPPDAPEHKYEIANGTDRGNGYQGYSSISYFLKQEHVPQEAKDNLLRFLEKAGFKKYVEQHRAKAN